MTKKILAYIAIGSLVITTFSVLFAVYTWNRANEVAVGEKRIILLQKIIELKALHAKSVGQFSVFIFQIERLPTPIHVKKKGVCIPNPKLHNYLKKIKEEQLNKVNKFKARAQNGVKEADELYSKYINYDVEFTRKQIEKEIINVDYKISFAKVLNKEPPKIKDAYPELYDYSCLPMD